MAKVIHKHCDSQSGDSLNRKLCSGFPGVRSKAVLVKGSCSVWIWCWAYLPCLMRCILAESKLVLSVTGRNGSPFAYLLASGSLDMSAASAPFHSILSPHSISGKNSCNLLPPAPALECALHAECSEVMGVVFALQWPRTLLECKTGAEM